MDISEIHVPGGAKKGITNRQRPIRDRNSSDWSKRVLGYAEPDLDAEGQSGGIYGPGVYMVSVKQTEDGRKIAVGWPDKSINYKGFEYIDLEQILEEDCDREWDDLVDSLRDPDYIDNLAERYLVENGEKLIEKRVAGLSEAAQELESYIFSQ